MTHFFCTSNYERYSYFSATYFDITTNRRAKSYRLGNGGGGGVQFLTALPRATGYLKTAQRDKTDWVHEHIDWAQVNCVSSWEMKKYFCRGKHDLLIDDSPRNIEDWIKVGGTGILHVTLEDTLQQLQRFGIT